MNGEKRAIRQLLRERRRRLSAAQVEAAGVAVRAQLRNFPPYRSAVSVIGYIADENETPTARLLEDIAQSGKDLYLPQPALGDVVVRWRPGEPLAVGRGAVLAPVDGVPAIPASPAVALVPVVAWDRTGTRLGRGGGFYDRLFARLTAGITRIGLAYEFQEIHELPRDPWDVSLHYVITERRLVECDRGEGVGKASLQKGGLQL